MPYPIQLSKHSEAKTYGIYHKINLTCFPSIIRSSNVFYFLTIMDSFTMPHLLFSPAPSLNDLAVYQFENSEFKDTVFPFTKKPLPTCMSLSLPCHLKTKTLQSNRTKFHIECYLEFVSMVIRDCFFIWTATTATHDFFRRPCDCYNKTKS